MDTPTLTDYFFESLVKGSVLVSSEVKYSAIKDYLNVFIREDLISENEIIVRNNNIINAREVFRIIFNNLNLTNKESSVMLIKINNYLFDLIISFYKNMDKNGLQNKKNYFISNILYSVLIFLKYSWEVFGEPLYDFFIKFLKQTKIWYNTKYAELIYMFIHAPDIKISKEDKFICDYLENILISNWIEYSRLIIDKSNFLNTQ